MSLFENEDYQYRDTFFVMFDCGQRPTSAQVKEALNELGGRYEVVNIRETEEGFESITVKSPYDFSAMDIVLVEGTEVENQVKELLDEFKSITLIGDEAEKLKKLKHCNARFDIYHFEQSDQQTGSEEEHLDPGALLLVIEKLTELSNGIGLDPQSMSLL